MLKMARESCGFVLRYGRKKPIPPKSYHFRSYHDEKGTSLKLKRLGLELYPHLLLEAKADTVLEIDGEMAKKTLGLATPKFFLDKPGNLNHAEKVEIGNPRA